MHQLNTGNQLIVERRLLQWLTLLAWITSFAAQAQFEILPHPHPQTIYSPSTNTRIKAAEAMPLPFWDDFSFVGKPGDTLWANKNSINTLDGYAINPPSIGAAVFDAINADGIPYSTDLISSGFSDTLLSRKIRLADVVPAQRDSVYLSFQYQWKGNGEAPDPSDYLQINFLDNTGNWVVIEVIQKPIDADETKFYNFIAPVKEPEFFHNAFQFLVVRYGRLAGAFDTWVVDYVYLNTSRHATSLSFPDRALSAGLSPLFNDYTAVPKDHFEIDQTMMAPTFKAATQTITPGTGDGSSVAYSTYLQLTSYYPGSTLTSASILDDSVGLFLFEESITQRSLINLPPISAFDFSADSIQINIETILESADIKRYEPGDANYDDASLSVRAFTPIQFRNNDTTRTSYWLSKYYAYDDGVAEYSVILAQAGKAAFKFTHLFNAADTLTGVYI
jgi:hypothetical protein